MNYRKDKYCDNNIEAGSSLKLDQTNFVQFDSYTLIMGRLAIYL